MYLVHVHMHICVPPAYPCCCYAYVLLMYMGRTEYLKCTAVCTVVTATMFYRYRGYTKVLCNYLGTGTVHTGQLQM